MQNQKLKSDEQGSGFKAMLLGARPGSVSYSLYSYKICKLVLSDTEFSKYNKLDKKRCSYFPLTLISGIFTFICFVCSGFMNFFLPFAIVSGLIYMSLCIKKARVEKLLKATEETARCKFESDWDEAKVQDQLTKL
ncbi:hypothetical protein EBX31_02200 [bacterium]|nr:hypothetical protein [bacterium]